MDAYAFALTLGTAGLAAMTVLGFHHGHAPGGSGHGHHSTHLRGGGRAGGHASHQHHAATSSRLLLGVLAFEALLLRPIWSLATRFVSDPAMTLRPSCPHAWGGATGV